MKGDFCTILPAQMYEDHRERMFLFLYLNFPRRENKGGRCGRREARPTDRLLRLGAHRRSAASTPDQTLRTERFGEGGGGGSGKREKVRRMTPIQYKCSIHCCFCIQPLDSVKCFNICAILKLLLKNCLHWPKVYSFIETIAYKCLFLFSFFFC